MGFGAAREAGADNGRENVLSSVSQVSDGMVAAFDVCILVGQSKKAKTEEKAILKIHGGSLDLGSYTGLGWWSETRPYDVCHAAFGRLHVNFTLISRAVL